ncbi:unnamed protein product [Ixodes pacificus]
MAGGHWKFRTAHKFGKRRKRRPVVDEVSSGTSKPSASGSASAPNCTAPSCAAPESAVARPSSSVTESGTTRVDTILISEAEQVEIEHHATEARQKLSSVSATHRKCSLLDEIADLPEVGTAFTVVSLTAVNALLECVKCKVCGGTVNISKGDREYGVAVKLVLSCAKCGELKSEWSSPRGKGNATCNPFEINILASLALVSTGNGQTVLNDLFSAMNISKRGLHKKTFQKCLKEKINPAAQKAAGTAMSECAGAVKTLYGDLNFGNPGNIAVSYDGTWMTRGHSSHIGVGSVIELFSGYVLDYVVLSNFCLGCEIGPKESDPAYQEWKDTHICQRNSSSKPGQMEVEAATILFERSLAKHGLRYTTMLCDGDSRSYNALQDANVYGFVEVEKEDCVNHVHKRMGTALRNLVQKQKGEGKPRLGGKGKLTADLITKLTMYYGWALKSHEGDIEKMQKAVMASYYHITSTDAKPNHALCPTGETSWCKQNAAVARNEAPPKHHYNLPSYVSDALLPVYTRLSDQKLLKRCQRAKTQNANESLHSVIWSLSSKEQHASLFSVECAVAQAVLRFNCGKQRATSAILKELHLHQGTASAQRSSEKDHQRLTASNRKHARAQTFTQAMKRKRGRTNDQDYIPGGF